MVVVKGKQAASAAGETGNRCIISMRVPEKIDHRWKAAFQRIFCEEGG